MHAVSVRPTRRTLVRGAAWSVPIVAVAAAAPAFAASACDLLTGKTLDWDGPNVTFGAAADRRSASAVFDPDLVGPISTLTLSITTSYEGLMRPGREAGLGSAMTVAPAVGGLGVSGVELEQATTRRSAVGRADRGTYTFAFTRPVSNLVFTVTDIDSLAGDFYDVLEPQPGFAVESSGTGIQTDFNGPNGIQRFYNTNSSVDDTDGSAGNIRFKYAGPISSFSLTYWNAAGNYRVDTNQRIFVSDMKFDYKPC